MKWKDRLVPRQWGHGSYASWNRDGGDIDGQEIFDGGGVA